MKTNWKLRILSIFMAASLVIGMAPVTAEAAQQVVRVTFYENYKNRSFERKDIIPKVVLDKKEYKLTLSPIDASQWYGDNLPSRMKKLELKLHIPEKIQEDYYLDRVEMNTGESHTFPTKKSRMLI